MKIPSIHALPITSAGDFPPDNLKVNATRAKGLVAKADEKGFLNKEMAKVKDQFVTFACKFFNIEMDCILVVRESLNQFIARKPILTPEIVFRCGLYLQANRTFLTRGIVVDSIDKTRLGCEVWASIKITDVKRSHRTDRGWIYNVECLVMNTPLAGTLFITPISSSFIKLLIRENFKAVHVASVYPEMLFGGLMNVALRPGRKGLVIQKVEPNNWFSIKNSRLKQSRQNCPKGVLCVDCFKGLDRCRFAVKKKSWKRVACPFCLKDTYENEYGVTLCKCYKESVYNGREY